LNARDIRDALARVRTSATFRNADRLGEFLEFVVNARLGANGPEIKETTIGVGLYHREPDYDPKIDSIVRTQARRVRARLADYYAGEGVNDPIEIQIPKGSYVPAFLRREQHPSSPAASAKPGSRWVYGAVAVLVLIAASGFVLWRHRSVPASSNPASANRASTGDVASVLVLPFRGSASSSEDQLYGYALADSVIAGLAGIQGLAILSPPASPGNVDSLAESDPARASAMKADYLVSGSFIRARDASAVTVKLTHVPDGSVLWSRTYRFPWSTLISTEREMSSAITSKLSESLSHHPSKTVSMSSPASREAYLEYMAGYYGAVQTRQSVNLAVYENAASHLERAIVLEPAYADAHSTLANLIAFRVIPWIPQNQVLLEKAEQHARTAIQYAPEHPGALAALARCTLYRRDPRKAHLLASKALLASSTSVEALCAAGDAFTALGMHESALQAFSAASERPFVTVEPLVFGALSALRVGDIRAAEHFVDLHGNVDPESLLHRSVLGVLRNRQGRLEESESQHRFVLQILESRTLPEAVKRQTYGFAGVQYALFLIRSGRLDAARNLASKLGPPLPRRIEDEILLLAALGKYDEAIKAIDDSIYFRNYRFLVTEPGLRPLHSHPGFKRLLEQTYPHWQAALLDLGPSLSVQPPALPSPSEFLRTNGA
jgi:TolB-like protein/tetratricopeptide (TPR) repeat protein